MSNSLIRFTDLLFRVAFLLVLTQLLYYGLNLIGGYADANKLMRGSQQTKIRNVSAEEEAVTELPATIVVQLSGEMGNNMCKLAQGHALSQWLKELTGLPTELVLRHQDASKWIGAAKDMRQCFPAFRHADFEQGNTPEFDTGVNLQKNRYGNNIHEMFYSGINSKDNRWVTPEIIEPTLRLFSELIRHDNKSQALLKEPRRNISVPFLYANKILNYDIFIDRYYDQFRRLFQWDTENQACCKLLPDPDESVFHFRNFREELGKKSYYDLGFDELSANETARKLFGHLPPHGKVAILTRFQDSAAQKYADALEARGLQVRLITGQSGAQDFCFLMHAQKEIVGVSKSTYFLWAGMLGNSSRVRMYSIDSEQRNRRLDRGIWDHYNWTHEELRTRFVFELIKTDE